MITSGDNEKLKLVRKLADRRWREKLGLFVVEGEDLVEAATRAGIDPVELLVAGENVEAALLAEVSALAHPPRVLGIYRREHLPSGTRDLTLALWHVADPGNVGTLVRAADGFAAGVALSPGCADPTGPKAVRASMGSLFRAPVSGFDEPDGRRIALVAHGGESLANLDLRPPLTLVLGAEREGLPEEVLARCEETATIALAGDAESLNVATAGAIALYEARR
jgi:TrmH family RNA methyltransferase